MSTIKRARLGPSTETVRSCMGSTALARWCIAQAGGTFHWDDDKLTCLLTEDELNDCLFLKNVLQGKVPTGRLYPLLLDDTADEVAQPRSLRFLRTLVAKPAAYDALNSVQRLQVAAACRDLFFADCKGLLDMHERALLKTIADLLSDECCFGELRDGGLRFSCCPTRHCQTLRFTSMLAESLSDDQLVYFAQAPLSPTGSRPAAEQPSPPVHAVFIDAHDLALHCYENILPLDRALDAFARQKEQLHFALDSLRCVDLKDTGVAAVWIGSVGGSTAVLDMVARSELYVTPLNCSTRGGRRFIFHSSMLGTSLTSAVRSALDKEPGLLGPDVDASSFVAVNPVFRCNRFEPPDRNFDTHRDTPYYDRTNRIISTHTLLIYVTGGSGAPALRIGTSVELMEIAPMSCIIFPQHCEHEGRPFEEGVKLFLRSELLAKMPPESAVERRPEIAALFSQATYLTGESVFHAALTEAAEQRYELANALHWGGAAAPPPHVAVLKELPIVVGDRNNGLDPISPIRFLTNGHDYWFLKGPPSSSCDGSDGGVSAELSLKQCAVLAVLDHFNCKVPALGAFKTLAKSSVVEGGGGSRWAWSVLRAATEGDSAPADCKEGSQMTRHSRANRSLRASSGAEEVVPLVIKACGASEKRTLFNQMCEPPPQLGPDDERHCCPFHIGNFDPDDPAVESQELFEPAKCDDVREEVEISRQFTLSRMLAASVLLLGRTVCIDESHILVIGDKIYLVKEESEGDASPPINFAACWNCEPLTPAHFVDVAAQHDVLAPTLVLPPISFVESKQGVHLQVDFFQNDWMVRVETTRHLAVPCLVKDVEEMMKSIEEDEDGGCNFRKACDPAFDASRYEWGSAIREGVLNDVSFEAS